MPVVRLFHSPILISPTTAIIIINDWCLGFLFDISVIITRLIYNHQIHSVNIFQKHGFLS